MPVMSFNKKLEQHIERLKQAGRNNMVEYHKKERAGPRSAEYLKRMKTAFAKASKKNVKSMYFAGTGETGYHKGKLFFKLGEVLAQGMFKDEKNAFYPMIGARVHSKSGKVKYAEKFFLWGTTGPIHVYQAAQVHGTPSGLMAIGGSPSTIPRTHNPEVIARSKAKKAKENAKANAKKANAKNKNKN